MKSLSDLLLEEGFDPSFKPENTHGRFIEFRDPNLGRGAYIYKEIEHEKGPIKYFTFRIWSAFEDFKTISQYPEGFEEKDLKKWHSKFEKDAYQIQEQLDAVYARGALQAQEIISKAKAPNHVPFYLANKKLNIQLGYLLDPENPEVMLIPLYNYEGALASIQTIYPDGQKQFMSGGKIRGSYGVIKGEGDIIYFCEGYATAASIFLATGNTVVFVGGADNYVEGLQSALRSHRYPIKVIACDDDIHLKENKGFNKGYTASHKFNCIIKSPRFQKPDGKNTTDFDDLRREEGLETVRTQLQISEKEKIEHSLKEGIFPLGHEDSTYFFTSTQNESIQAFKSLAKMDLFKLMPEEFWEQRYGEEGAKGTVVKWESIASKLFQESHAIGQFSNDKMRGIGVYQENDKTIVHLGNRLWVDGQEHNLRGFPSEYTYVFSKKLRDIEKVPMTDEEVATLWGMIERLSFKERTAKFYMAGWLVSSILGGSLKWRPHLYLTGLKGTGKTTVLNFIHNFLSRGFQANHHDPVSGSAAGIRQGLSGANIPVILDEVEGDSKHMIQKVEAIIQLFRIASSNTTQGIMGTAGQKAVRVNVNFSGIIAGICPQLKNDQDISRFSQIELKQVSNADEMFELEKIMNFCAREDFARRFVSRVILHAKIVINNIDVLTKELMRIAPFRLAQQYGALWGAALLLKKTTAITEEDIEFFKGLMKAGDETIQSSQSNVGEDELIDVILAASIFDEDNKRTTVRREIIKPTMSERMQEIVGEYGVTLAVHKNMRGIHIRETADMQRQLEKSNIHGITIKVGLKRLKDAKRIQIRFQGRRCWGIWVPMEKVIDYDPNSEPDKNY